MRLTDEQRIESAILHGKIGGLEQVLTVVRGDMTIRTGAGVEALEHIERWLLQRLAVNREMLRCLRETGEIPEVPQKPPPDWPR